MHATQKTNSSAKQQQSWKLKAPHAANSRAIPLTPNPGSLT